MQHKLEAVIFDLDGTLIDSMWVWSTVDEVFLGKRGMTPPKDIEEQLEGMSFTETAMFFKDYFKLEESIEAIKAEWCKLAEEFYTEKMALKVGVCEFLDYLKSNDIKLGISTSNNRQLVEKVLEHLQVRHFFEVIVTSCEVEKGKPHPFVYQRAAEQLKVNVEDCLVFEDVPNGVRAGLDAGMHVWAIKDRQTDQVCERLQELAMDYVQDYHEAMAKLKAKDLVLN